MSWTTVFFVTSHWSSNWPVRHVHSSASGLCFSYCHFCLPSHHYHHPLPYLHCLCHSVILPSTQGGKKSFTWASHLTVVIVYCIAMIVVYVQSRTIASFNSNKLISAVYAVLTHMLNPFIYCLRNQEVKNAIKKTMGVGQRLLLSWALLPWGRNSVPERMLFQWHLSWLCKLACFIDLDF